MRTPDPVCLSYEFSKKKGLFLFYLRVCCFPGWRSRVRLPWRRPSLTWEQVRSKFEAVNPALKADAFGVDELRAEEITAYLRPNPQFNFAADGTQFPPHKGPWTPLTSTQYQSTFSYLHERQHKRELRLESAVEGHAHRSVTA